MAEQKWIEREYPIENEPELTALVYETKRQKDILEILDELLEWGDSAECNVFEDEFFAIKYKDGTYYFCNNGDIEGVYKKKNIAGIIYSNTNDTWIYGKYEVNEYGIATLV